MKLWWSADLGRRVITSRHDWVEGFAPILFGIVHHNVDEYRHKKPKDFSAVLNLRPVDTAVPG
jgi:hypothetical protein